ncbi:Uncharacterised protein [Bordetella pertussis]|nr:Uncharacterised protein [Bordetella pertussis]
MNGPRRRGAPYREASCAYCATGSRPRCAHNALYQWLPMATWPISSRRMISRMAAPSASPAAASLSRISGEASRPRASSVRGTSARRASRSARVFSAISHRPLWAGKSP